MQDTTLVQIDNLLRFINSAETPEDMRCGFPGELDAMAVAASRRKANAIEAGDMNRAAKAGAEERRYIKEMRATGWKPVLVH